MRSVIACIAVLLLAMCLSASNGISGPLVTFETWRTKAPTYTVGNAVWYAPGVMEANVVRRWDIKWEGTQWPTYSRETYIDGVALMSPSDIGETVWLKRPGGVWEGPFLVVDCAMRGDMYNVVAYRGEVVEVGWKTASKWGLGPHDGGWRLDGVEVYIAPHPPVHGSRDAIDNMPLGDPVDYQKWFLSIAKIEVCRVWVSDHDWISCRN